MSDVRTPGARSAPGPPVSARLRAPLTAITERIAEPRQLALQAAAARLGRRRHDFVVDVHEMTGSPDGAQQ